MENRREFLKKTSLLTFGAGLSGSLPAAIRKALVIDPKPGSTFYDAEHVVILMQENRSFDHCFGSLQGVRGFNDPRAFQLANGNPVWMQTNRAGQTFVPFRLNLETTKATWMGSLPHSRQSQVDAYNDGLYDNWLNASFLSNKKYSDIPFTLGYYNREDLPFNYAMADAFTICDQNFSSAMTSTWPNRHFMWSGNIREQPHDASSRARIRNDLAFGEASWRTFPEILEQNEISWRIYQNDLTAGGGFEGEERSWLTNFTCNTLEYFSQYHVKFSRRYIDSLQVRNERLAGEIARLLEKIKASAQGGEEFRALTKEIHAKQKALENVKQELEAFTPENFRKLNDFQKNLHEKAFTTNRNDPDYRTLESFSYHEGNEQRTVQIPKGDILHQFRVDVRNQQLPTVSWLVAPQKFSDHPSAPWYGSWFVSEVLNVLTESPEVWKKTIFILTYDENDGYFDHIPPFMPPHPDRMHAGKCSRSIDGRIEFISKTQEISFGVNEKAARGGMAGLGYRVPMIIASPWSRGGRVNSQVFDHTSILRFLESFLTKKTGRKIVEDQIGSWRRNVCGDLTSVFQAFNPKADEKAYLLKKEPYIKKIYDAQFYQEPDGYRPLTKEEIIELRKDIFSLNAMPRQEVGIRKSCALPYQFYADGNLEMNKDEFILELRSSDEIFGSQTSGAAFTAYSYFGEQRVTGDKTTRMEIRQYAVAAAEGISDHWKLASFPKSEYDIRLSGPNGFYREFSGDAKDPGISVRCAYEKSARRMTLTGNLLVSIHNDDANRDYEIVIYDQYRAKNFVFLLAQKSERELIIDLKRHFGWYEISIRVSGFPMFKKLFAGHVETGSCSFTDPLMGKIL